MTTSSTAVREALKRGRITDADNPPEAPKLTGRSRSSLEKSRLGKELAPSFLCQNCETTPASMQLSCKHIICPICLMNFHGNCPVCP